MQETWVQSLGWEDPLEKGKATHFSILAWRILRTHEVSKSRTQLSNFHFTWEPILAFRGYSIASSSAEDFYFS